VSNGSWKSRLASAILRLPEETESGSAGKQPDKGYSGRRCANGASGPLGALASRGRFVATLWTPKPCLKNPSPSSDGGCCSVKWSRLALAKQALAARRALGIYFGVYNFCQRHSTIKSMPAVASGLAQERWTVAELIERTANYTGPKPEWQTYLDTLPDES
jgi:hypothetical protein